MSRRIELPDGRRFAFSILDDTDDATLENVKPVYDRLAEYGFRTTKTVWPMHCPEGSRIYFAADTLQRAAYLEFARDLERAGFEIASHGATMESSLRERTTEALEFLRDRFESMPVLHANHGQNRDNLYWGAQRFRTPWLRGLVRLLRRQWKSQFEGEREGSAYFWGDLAQRHIRYVRNFTFSELDMRRANPGMPYQLRRTPYVRAWFSTTDAPDVDAFKVRVTRQGIDRLERDGGVCIVSTHLGKGYARDGKLDPEVDALLRELAGRPGWFAPVSEILEHLETVGGGGTLGPVALLRLEVRFLFDQMFGAGRRYRDAAG